MLMSKIRFKHVIYMIYSVKQFKQNNEYDIQHLKTTTEMQALDLEQAHTEFDRVKQFCWCQYLTLPNI